MSAPRSASEVSLDRLKPLEASVRDFVSAVLDRAPSIGVRGEMTCDYLRGLGYRDVEVIGCPSMFLNGDRLRVEKTVPHLERDTPISAERLALQATPWARS